MIKFFGDFCQFLAKIAFFTKTNVTITFFQKLNSILSKIRIFSPFFIGPSFACFVATIYLMSMYAQFCMQCLFITFDVLQPQFCKVCLFTSLGVIHPACSHFPVFHAIKIYSRKSLAQFESELPMVVTMNTFKKH
jgi:hypothetical protein